MGYATRVRRERLRGVADADTARDYSDGAAADLRNIEVRWVDQPCLLMRRYGFLFVCMLCSSARMAVAQLSVRDTTALVDAVAERIHTRFGTGAARESFVITARNPHAWSDVRFAMRVSDAVHARDSSLIAASPTRSTPRIHLGASGLLAGDTATVTLWLARCTGTPEIFSSYDASVAFRRVGGRWAYVERNIGGSGAGSNGCPW